MSKAILFLNLGGPETLKDVKPFLYRLFSDPEIIRIKFSPLRKFIAWMISTTREKKSQALYKKIGGGSPIRRLTDEQALRVEAELNKKGLLATVKTAFTCSDPLIKDVVKDLSKRKVDNFLSFPLYPQYSFTTTKSALDQVRSAVQKYSPNAKLTEIHSWPVHPLFLQVHSELIQEELKKFVSVPRSDVYILFSAHSIPERLVTKEGDPYKEQMERCVKGIIEKASWTGSWSLAWQSKLGPVKWLSPATIDVIQKLGEKGTKGILVVPVAFVTDHIETLEEIDVQMRDMARESGIQEFRRTPGLNSHPTFINALVDIAESHKDFWA